MPDQPTALAQAKTLLEHGDYYGAANAYQRAATEGDLDSTALTDWAEALAFTGRLDLALEKIDSALSRGGGDGGTYAIKVDILRRLGRLDDAFAALEQAVHAVEDYAPLYVQWGMLLAEQGVPEQARWKFERAVTIDDGFAPAHLGLGEVLFGLGLPEEAAAEFARVGGELDKRNGPALVGWARSLVALGKHDEAVTRFEEAIALEEEQPVLLDLWRETGVALYELKRFAEALDAYGKAIALESRFAVAPQQKYLVRYGSAQAALSSNQPELALTHCGDGLALLDRIGQGESDAAASLHFASGAAHMMLRFFDEAVTSFRGAAEASADFALHSMNAVASVLAMQGNYEGAWEELSHVEEARERVGANQESHLDDEQLSAYGTALLWLDRLDDAEGAFEEALELGDRNAAAWAKLMAIHLERREQDIENANEWRWKAFRAYRKAVSLVEAQHGDRSSAEPALALGLLHLLMDDLDKAEPHLQEAAKLETDNSLPLAGLGLVLVRREKHREAITQFELALKREPDELNVRCHLADAYFRLGRPTVALEIYEEVLRIAPGNVGAQFGAGEILIEQAEETKDDRLYEDAEANLSKAIELAESARGGSRKRRGSSGLTVRQWADLYYLRGCARIKLYEAKKGRGIAQRSGAGRLHLQDALRDFEACEATRVRPHRARRAADQVREGLKLSPLALTNRYATYAVVSITFVVLLGVQFAFIRSGGFNGDHDPIAYSTLTLSLLVLLAAGFYLPEVLKLRFGGIELEKGAATEEGDVTLDIHREPLQASLHAALDPPVPRGRTVEPGDVQRRSESRGDALRGTREKADSGGSRKDAKQGADESVD
ncbi:MAG: tetratricopeptide repeat protein [Solirubrobacterales bacterium]